MLLQLPQILFFLRKRHPVFAKRGFSINLMALLTVGRNSRAHLTRPVRVGFSSLRASRFSRDAQYSGWQA